MAIFIIGGSNSIFKDGWVSYFSARTPEPCIIKSVGATTTITGIYRMLLPDGPTRGDCVIWEYALNEMNHIGRGYDRTIVLKNVEHFIQLCQNNGCRLAPVVFTPQRQEAAPSRNEYFHELHALFGHYGIAVFDVSSEFRRLNGVDRISDDLFMDNAHYVKSPTMMDFIASGALTLVERATIPTNATPVYTSGRSLTLIDGFQDKVFQNSLMTIPVAKVPLSLKMASSGRIIAIYALCFTGFDSGVRIELHHHLGGSQQMRFSTTHTEAIDRPIFKAISIEQAHQGDWAFSPGDEVKMFPALKGGVFYNEFQVKGQLKNLVPPPPVISGLLAEMDPC